MKNSIEDIIEKAGGWKHGMRKKFDEALINKKSKLIKKLLPSVPEEYLARGFGERAYNLLLKKRKAVNKVLSK